MNDLTKQEQRTQALINSLPQEIEQLLNMKGIDWTGKLMGVSPTYLQAIPVVIKGSRTYQQLIEAIRMMEVMLQPASSMQIMQSLANLRLHFPLGYMTEAQLALLMRDYIANLAIYPIDIIEQACIDYKRAADSEYFPKLGKIIALINKYWYLRKWELEKSKKLLAKSETQGNQE